MKKTILLTAALLAISPIQAISADSLTPPEDFNLIVELTGPKTTSTLDVSKGQLTRNYKKEMVFRGEKLKQKTFKVGFTDHEKNLLWQYILRNQVLSIEPGDYNAYVELARYPRIYHTFKITKDGVTKEYKVEGLNHLTKADTINKFWGLFKMLELMLNPRRLSMQYELWIIDDLRERVKKMDAGEPLPFPDDQFPAPFRNILKKPERLKKFIESWDKTPIAPIPLIGSKKTTSASEEAKQSEKDQEHQQP